VTVLSDAPSVAASGDWPQRLLLTAVVVAVIGGCLALMRLGWVRRGARQLDIESMPAVPDVPRQHHSSDVTDIEARYIGANRSGDWLDRVVVHGLGTPSSALVTVRGGTRAHPGGVWVTRAGAPDVFVGADYVVGVRHDQGAAARAFERDGVLIVTWRHGDALIDIGLRVRDADAAERLRIAIAALTTIDSTTGDRT
jgi:hypothetical protein